MYRLDKPAESAYQALVRQLPKITSLFVVPYRNAPDYENRITVSVSADEIMKRSRSRRAEQGTPFWDAVILEAMAVGPIEEIILDGALYHQSLGEPLLEVSRKEVLGPGIVTIVEKSGIPNPWAVLSRVRTLDGAENHLPMLDFRCSISRVNLISLQRVAGRLLDCPWVIIESEHSYHLLGASLMSDRELTKFFGRAILLGPLVDRNYVAHQLINGIAALRVVSVPVGAGLKTRMTTFPHSAWEDSIQSAGKKQGGLSEN